MYRILVINPGSTSTKIAVFDDDTKVCGTNIEHTPEELGDLSILEQAPMRKHAILTFLAEQNIDISGLSAVVGRGGILPPVQSGAYLVDENMIAALKHLAAPHASNLGGLIAAEIAALAHVDAYIYDSIAVDEMDEMTHLSGTPLIRRTSHFHALNSRAMAIEYAKSQGKAYSDLNLIVAHMGGGISTSAHCHGKVVDVTADDEGTFSPTRAGRVHTRILVDVCFSGEFEHRELQSLLRGKGGLFAYLGTSDAREVEKRILGGDQYAEMVYRAMAYQICKDIGSLAASLYGKVDAIILTGGVAYSDMLTAWIREQVSFLALVVVLPGEHEMEALSQGVIRVLRGEEHAQHFTI